MGGESDLHLCSSVELKAKALVCPNEEEEAMSGFGSQVLRVYRVRLRGFHGHMKHAWTWIHTEKYYTLEYTVW